MANKDITERSQTVNINSPMAMKKFADSLKSFIVTQGLFITMEDAEGNKKNYVLVEGWQFAGASMGIFPIPKRVEAIPTEGNVEYKNKKGYKVVNPIYKYRAEVELKRLSSGEVVGGGVAVCSNQEWKKRTFDEYAVASMAQTRAVGKAYRLTIGWIMKLAGYEPVPAEEAQDMVEQDEPVLEMPIEDVKYLVNTKLAAMTASQKVKMFKDYGGTINEKNIDDKGYRRIYAALAKEQQYHAKPEA